MQITTRTWNNYIARLSRLNEAAGQKMREYIRLHGTENTEQLISYAYAVITRYGEGSAELACQMYDALAEAEGMLLPAAEPAATASYGEVARMVHATKDQNPENLPSGVSRLVKRAGADTTLYNAVRDGAQWAWVPHGDTCPFCITLASRGWQRASKKMLKGGHAEHIHSNCDCEFAVRFHSGTNVAGYDPEKYLRQYRAAGSDVNAMRRIDYAARKDAINAQKRAAYAARTKTTSAPQPASFTNTNGISSTFASGMSSTLKQSSHSEVRDVYAKYQSEIKCTDNQHKKGAYFMSTDGGIHFNEQADALGSGYQTPYEVAFHEFGHNIDWLIGGKNNFTYASNQVYNGRKLENIIKTDYLAFKKAKGAKSNAELLIMLKAENMPLKECGNISDILEFCMNKSYPLGVGHGVAYHKYQGSTEREFFAEVLDSAAANEASFKQLQRIFPNAVDFVFDIIKGVI